MYYDTRQLKPSEPHVMPKKQRLTREESREQTRKGLVEAAGPVIAKLGLAAARVEDIAEYAGYTRGAFYSNFESKLEVFIELLKKDHVGIQHDLQQLLDADVAKEDLQQALTSLYTQCYHDRNSYLLWAEARHYALRDEEFRQRLNALTLEKRDVIAYFIAQFCQRMGLRPPLDPNVLALTMMTLIDGVLYLNMSMPDEMPEDALRNALRTFFKATFFSGQNQAAAETAQ